MFSLSARGRRIVAPAIAAVLGLQACNNSVTVAPGTPAFALTLGASALTVDRGSTTTTSIKATRSTGLIGPITYAVNGAPAGLNAVVISTSVVDSSTLAVAATATIAAGNYPITLHASAPGAMPQDVPIVVTVSGQTTTGDPEILSVVLGGHSCALSTSFAAYCWGYNANGQLGNNDTSFVNPIPIPVLGGLALAKIDVSKLEDFTCALTTAGKAYCWGENDLGQLGDGTTTRRLVPTPVAGGLTLKALAVGANHVCAITTEGNAYCWGRSPNGAFGDGSVGLRVTPAPAAAGLTLRSIVAGSDFTCGLTPAGAAFCWGLGVQGQLGDGNRTTSRVPVAVAGGRTFQSLAAGGQAVCGLTTSGEVFCWGQNSFGTLGDGTQQLRSAPVTVAGGLTFTSLSAGYQTMCGVTPAGTGYCWGYNLSGQIGDGTEESRSTPTPIAGNLTFRSVSSGVGSSCGVTIANALYCWGDNSNGGLGDGTVSSHDLPAPVHWR
jgi:hypothetical protein